MSYTRWRHSPLFKGQGQQAAMLASHVGYLNVLECVLRCPEYFFTPLQCESTCIFIIILVSLQFKTQVLLRYCTFVDILFVTFECVCALRQTLYVSVIVCLSVEVCSCPLWPWLRGLNGPLESSGGWCVCWLRSCAPPQTSGATTLYRV